MTIAPEWLNKYQSMHRFDTFVTRGRVFLSHMYSSPTQKRKLLSDCLTYRQLEGPQTVIIPLQVEADVMTYKGWFRAAVPSGASTGIYEAVELRDKGKE